MGRVCAVATCKTWCGGKLKKKKDSSVSFFKFPSDKNVSSTWLAKCKRADAVDPTSSFICSNHFLAEDYDPGYLMRVKLMPEQKHLPTLKPDAIPSLNLPSTASRDAAKAERLQRRCTKRSLGDVLHQHQPAKPAAATAQPVNTRTRACTCCVRRLSVMKRMQAQHQADRLKWRRETARLRRQVSHLRRKNRDLQHVQSEGVLSQRQLQRLATGRRKCWSATDVSRAIGLRSISRKAYAYVQDAMKVPMPSNSTLSRWTRGFQLESGVIDAALWVLQPAVQAMTPLERIACVCFDEMALHNRPTYDQSADAILDGSKLQLMMVRGLCSSWKQPIFYEIEKAVTPAKLATVVSALDRLGLDIRAVSSDMGPSNVKLWRDSGVEGNRTWILHPEDDSKKIWVFADVPHLIKLVRTHVVKDDGGLRVSDGRGGETLLDAAPFRALRALGSAEKKICPRLTDLCVEARGQTAQRVYLATRLFSHTVAAAVEDVLGDERTARPIRIIDHWFDVMNSRSASDAKLERCGYGVSDEAKMTQDTALDNMVELMANARVKRGAGQAGGLLPFQSGILLSIASLRGLYQDLKSAYADVRYIMTARLNQDCLENVFSQLRSMCGPNTHPDAVEVRQRLRILLMAPSALRAVSCPERAVEVEQSQDFVSTGLAPAAPPSTETLSAAALDGLDILFVDSDGLDAAEVDHDYAKATNCQQHEAPANDLGLERDGLAFIAGYVAFKMKHVDASLGCPSSEATETLLASVPSSWLVTISRGRLYVPQTWWMAVVEQFDTDFCSIMGPTFDKKVGILKRLVGVIGSRHPGLDIRVARRLARIRLHIRVTWLRQTLLKDRSDRRAAKQLRQHATSHR